MLIPLRSISQVTKGCETLLAVLGMTSIVSTACHYVGVFFQLLLRHDDNDEEKSVASVSAVLFFVLALQTGLTRSVTGRQCRGVPNLDLGSSLWPVGRCCAVATE